MNMPDTTANTDVGLPDNAPEQAPEHGADHAPAPAAGRKPMPHGACMARLSELFPALFTGPVKPLKLRIQADIQVRAPGVFTKADLSAFFRRYTGATAYLVAVSRSQHRYDLDGAEAGELSDEHRQIAQEELQRRRAAQQAQREQEHADRRQRAQLLRDFETTRLTEANFCALKGIAPEALEGLLAQARAEAAEMPRSPAVRPGREDRRNPHHGKPGGRGQAHHKPPRQP